MSNTGPLGQPRGVAFVIILSIITLGIYSLYWVYKTQEEMKQHTGDGLGGVLGLVIWIIIYPVSAFVIPSEVGNMYAGDGKPKPVTGWTGLWLFPFGICVIRSGFIPRFLGVLLMVAGCGYIGSSLSELVFPQYADAVERVTRILSAAELPIIFWLLIWGAKEQRKSPA